MRTQLGTVGLGELAKGPLIHTIVCDAPAGRLEGAAAYLEFLEPFTRILTGATIFAAFGNETTALVCYDTATLPVPSAPRPNWSPSPTAESPPAASSSTGCRSKQHARDNS
ncbi:hypothetical protein C5E41_31785 [Nocardia nova]|nr:hypothetical protein C5E41_31785 [Nocardia nova]